MDQTYEDTQGKIELGVLILKQLDETYRRSFAVQAGIPANKALQNATLNAARIMKLDGDLGSIAAGELANVTLVNGDPVANISDIRKTITSGSSIRILESLFVSFQPARHTDSQRSFGAAHIRKTSSSLDDRFAATPGNQKRCTASRLFLTRV